jgi:DNA-binding MarR family transcriptional regulator
MSFNYKKTIAYQISQISKMYRVRASCHLQEIGLYPGQEQVLKELAENDGQSMGELATLLNVKPPTITKMIARLQQKDFLEKRECDKDARLSHIHITDKGKDLVERLDKTWKRMDKEIFKDMEEKDRKKLKKLLRSVEANLLGKKIEHNQHNALEKA